MKHLSIFFAIVVSLSPAVMAGELSCEEKDNAEGGCCCFQQEHTYEFEAEPVSRLEVTFDTGRGIGCRSQVSIQLLHRTGWKTLRTVDAISSDGRSQINRLTNAFELGETIGGVRIGDGGRCYIDYSKIVLGEAENGGGFEIVPKPGGLVSGTYQLEAYSNRLHTSTWHLKVANGRVTGTSEWDCCPGRRKDALKGTVQGDRVQIDRNCSGQGLSGRCYQTYRGTISNRGVANGSWTQNSNFAGKWTLEPTELAPPPEAPSVRIVADPEPPYREMPVTIDFALAQRPFPGAVWWMDGRRMTNAEIFFWTFDGAGDHEVEVRDAQGKPIAHYDVRLFRPTERRVEIVPDRDPPFDVPMSLTFRQQPRPIPGARWYVDDTYASSSQTLTREFLVARSYEISLRLNNGQVLADYEVSLEETNYLLSGRRWREPRFGGVREDLRELELERSAAVTEVEGSAESYCIWTVGAGGAQEHRVVCGNASESIVGAILLPGSYVVVPDLLNNSRETEVTIHLRSR